MNGHGYVLLPTVDMIAHSLFGLAFSSMQVLDQNIHKLLPYVQFAKNYPGEILDAHSTPSVGCWSLIHQQQVNKHVKHVPIQLRLSEHQYSSMIETRSSKPLGSEIQLLSQLCWEDTPAMDIGCQCCSLLS